MERAQNRLSAGSPPCVWCGSGREVTLSLTGKKNGSRTECRSTSRGVRIRDGYDLMDRINLLGG